MDDQVTSIPNRKDEHLRICLEENVRSTRSAGFEKIELLVDALPDLNFGNIDTSQVVFDKMLSAPILISSMTGGSGKTKYFNQMLAQAANEFDIAMAVGSQRAAIIHPELEETFRIVRREAPGALLFANLGAVQFNYGFGVKECQKAVDMLEADGLYLHLNALQEALQPEGDRDFSDLLLKIENLSGQLSVPVLVKEVSCGISYENARRLIDAGVQGIDVAGLGGTSWSAVEMHRQTDLMRKNVCRNFIDWGIPTADCLLSMIDFPENIVLVSSGGLETGIDIAKSIAMGADLSGFARKFIVAANAGELQLRQTIEQLILELKIAMYSTNSATLTQLAGKWELKKGL